MTKKDDTDYKRFLQFIIGCFALAFGITLILSWWDSVVILFQGMMGMILAVGGLVTLYLLKK